MTTSSPGRLFQMGLATSVVLASCQLRLVPAEHAAKPEEAFHLRGQAVTPDSGAGGGTCLQIPLPLAVASQDAGTLEVAYAVRAETNDGAPLKVRYALQSQRATQLDPLCDSLELDSQTANLTRRLESRRLEELREQEFAKLDDSLELIEAQRAPLRQELALLQAEARLQARAAPQPAPPTAAPGLEPGSPAERHPQGPAAAPPEAIAAEVAAIEQQKRELRTQAIGVELADLDQRWSVLDTKRRRAARALTLYQRVESAPRHTLQVNDSGEAQAFLIVRSDTRELQPGDQLIIELARAPSPGSTSADLGLTKVTLEATTNSSWIGLPIGATLVTGFLVVAALL